jgi:nucleoside phosphorylase
MRLLLFWAVPREIGEASRMLGSKTRLSGLPFRAFRFGHLSHTIVAAETGVGMESATRVFLRLMETEKADAAVSLGYCGALTHDAGIGDLIWASQVCLTNKKGFDTISLPDQGGLLKALSARIPIRAGTFFTLSEPMKKEEIVRIVPSGTPLPVCDMETFVLARLSLAHGLSFLAIRGVSDGASEDLPFDPRAVCDSTGTYRTYRAVRLFLSRPRLLVHGIKLRRSSNIASHSLALALNNLLQLL